MTTPTQYDVAQLRHESRLSARAFGELVYASESSVQAWEAGRRTCPPASWELLQVYFGKQRPRVKPGVRVHVPNPKKGQRDIERAMAGLQALHKALGAFTKEQP